MKKLLLLGGSRYLLPVIREAKELGLYTITCDYLPDNIAHRYSDAYHNVSITDLEATKKLAGDLGVDGVMSFACDPGVVTAAYVAEELGLPNVGPYESVCILQDKARFRGFLREHGFRVPGVRSYDSMEAALKEKDSLPWPQMVKPVDCAGSKGVSRADGPEALEQAKELLPDVVFSDIKMPEMDGIELISRLRREMPAVLCVIVSGYSDFEYMKAAIQQSAADYLLKPVNPEELKRLLQRLEATLLAREQQMIPRRESDAAALAERVRLYLQENYDQPVDFSSLADSLAVSSPYLSKLFHEQEGKSPSRYLTDLRMRKAQKLLMDTQLTVREIAVRVGYPDPFHFSRNFKNAMGISPVQFREERAGKERRKGDGSGEED